MPQAVAALTLAAGKEMRRTRALRKSLVSDELRRTSGGREQSGSDENRKQIGPERTLVRTLWKQRAGKWEKHKGGVACFRFCLSFPIPRPPQRRAAG
ncbi:hypothetical protein MRX96_058354 [Rhipicephalus microplus]